MRILLTFTNVQTLVPFVFPSELGALSAFLRQHGHQVRVHLVSSAADLRSFRRVLEDYQPELLGISAVYNQAARAAELAALAKAWRPDLPVILGGKHATLAPELAIACPHFDGVCVGEGEHALLELVQTLERGDDPSGIQGFWYRRPDGSVQKNPCRPFIQDLDALPLPDYGAVDLQQIIDRMFGTAFMVLGRGGCPHGCRFCGVPPQAARGSGCFVRMPSVGRAIEHIEWLDRRYRFRHIYFRDDTLTLNRGWFLAFAAAFGDRFEQSYELLTRADYLDPEVVRALADSRCSAVWLGADSGNEHIRTAVLGKTIDNATTIDACDRLFDAGIKPMLTNMVGLPHETPEQFDDTVALNRRVYGGRPTVTRAYGVSPAVFVFNPFPGTPLWDECLERGWLKGLPDRVWSYADSYVSMPQFPPREVLKRARRFRHDVYRPTNPAFARLCLAKDSTIRRWIPSLGPSERFMRRLEHRLAHRRSL